MEPTGPNSPPAQVTTTRDVLGDYPKLFREHLERQHYRPTTLVESHLFVRIAPSPFRKVILVTAAPKVPSAFRGR